MSETQAIGLFIMVIGGLIFLDRFRFGRANERSWGIPAAQSQRRALWGSGIAIVLGLLFVAGILR